MALNAGAVLLLLRKFKPHMVMVLAQMCVTFLYFLSEASFNHGLDTRVYTAYRLLIGAASVFPVAYFMERQERPKLTLSLFGEIFLLSLTGTSLPISLFYASLNCTSPTFVAVMMNTFPPIVFVAAVILRMESLQIKSPHGIAKILGCSLSLTGVIIMTLYKGYELSKLKGAPIHMEKKMVKEDWLKGSIFVVASCASFATSCILQGRTLKRYPTPLSLSVWMNLLGALMAMLFMGITLRRPKSWLISFDIEFWSVLYGGLIGSGFLIFVQLWCIKAKGPVFTTMFNPLGTVMSAFVAYFLVGEKLYIGSIIGGITVAIGLHMLLWGKEGDESDQDTKLAPDDGAMLSPSSNKHHKSIELPTV